MRLATARDEIEPLRSAEGRANEAYLAVLLLARTVTRIGEVANRRDHVQARRLVRAMFDAGRAQASPAWFGCRFGDTGCPVRTATTPPC